MRTRPVLAVAMTASALAGLTLATPSSATVLGSLCEINGGKVTFVKKPVAAPGDISYTLTATVEKCTHSANNPHLDPAQKGAYQVGGVVEQGNTSYALKPGSGTASCAGGSTTGEGAVVWADGTVSVIEFTTVNAGRVVTVRGSIVESAASGLKTTNTKYQVGDAFNGPLLLAGTDMARCADTGIPTADASGHVTIGHVR